MDQLLSRPILSDIVASIVIFAAGYLISLVQRLIKRLPIRRFWSLDTSKQVNIIVSDVECMCENGKDESSHATGLGELLGFGYVSESLLKAYGRSSACVWLACRFPASQY